MASPNNTSRKTVPNPETERLSQTSQLASYALLSKGVEDLLIIHPEKVVKKGFLYKKGSVFNRYKEQYLFYLEEPMFLKSGKKGKPLSSCVDLYLGQLRHSADSRTKFKVVTPKVTLSLKAENEKERDEWIEAIR